jgi:hypothetical protein
VYRIDIDREHAIISFVLDGSIRPEEMKQFFEGMKAAAGTLSGREIKVKSDLRTFKPLSQESVDTAREMQQLGIQLGVVRVAELVESHTAALQLNRVARESGADKIMRRFTDEAEARAWLIHGDAAE